MNHFIVWLKGHAVLSISAALAVLSMLLVPPSKAYLDYIDFRVLGLLFCLMAVVAALQSAGLFAALSTALLQRMRTTRSLALALVLLPFFTSMWITNDVALITFVPFAILAYSKAGHPEHMAWTIVLQTVAANLGSMLTPVGNPQNLYLYQTYGFTPGRFLMLMLPLTLLSLALLIVLCLRIQAVPLSVELAMSKPMKFTGRFLVYVLLFLLSLACVFRLLAWPVLLGLVCIALFFCDRHLFARVDYGLLLTFVFFFLLVGNLGALPAVRQVLSALMAGREVVVTVIASQFLSNVPAAVLLSQFTEDGAALVLGSNLGGLGTLIASMASLISYQAYNKVPGANMRRYLAQFTGANLLFLAILLPVTLLLLV